MVVDPSCMEEGAGSLTPLASGAFTQIHSNRHEIPSLQWLKIPTVD